MYVFTDPKVLENLQKIVNAYSKFGEHIRLVATPTSLQLSVVNGSLTSLGTCTFATPLFTGPGATKNVHIKSRAADYVFKRVENEDISCLQLRFRTSRTGQEQLEVQLDCGNNIKKLFRVACLNTAILPMDFEPEGAQPFTFECSPSVLKDALASCEAGADEVKVSFQHNLVNILARRKGMSKGEFSGLRSGLRTIINLQPETFRQVTVATPRQLDFKLKEFRVMLGFFTQLGEDVSLLARFSQLGAVTMPLRFSNRVAAYPGVEYVFKFMARVSIPRTNSDRPQMLKVGRQPDWLVLSGSRSTSSSRGADSATDLALRSARRERDRRLRHLASAASRETSTPEPVSPVALNVSSLSSHSTHSAVPGPPQWRSDTSEAADENENENEHDEIGFTQGAPTPVRGLFD